MSSHALYTGRCSTKVLSIYGCFAALTLVCTSVAAWSQQPQLSSLKNPPAFTNTPHQVRQGSATLVEAYPIASKLRLAISIKAPKMAEEEAFLKQLQDKTSPNFHKYLSPEQWNARFAPAAEDEQAVVDWATSQGLTITARYPNRLMVNVEGTVETIQKAFNIKINRYSVNGQTEFSNDRDPEIPANLQGAVEFVDGLNSIVRMRPANSRMSGVRGPDYSPGPMHQVSETMHANADSAAAQAVSAPGAQIGSQITNGFYDPSDFWSQQGYDYNALQAQGHCCNPLHNAGQTPPETSIGLATDGDFADSDMVGFQAQYPYLAYHYGRVFVNGTPTGGDGETTLDLEWTTATSNSRGSYIDTSLIWVYEAAQGFGDFGTLFQQMVNDNKIRVVNISYGLSEQIFLDDAPSLLTSWHSIFNQMIGQGWTIMAASGDGGSDAGCTGSLAVLYPESDPDVTSVGGTELFLNLNGSFNSEVAWTGGTSPGSCSANNGGGGGGCSAVWAAPSYQTRGTPYCGSGSRSVPDVSLNAGVGTNFFFNGSLQGVGGTSLASPLMSGFIAQENAYSLSMGNACDGTHNCAPIGQVDFDIYAEGGYNHSAPHYPFYDITSGCTTNDTLAVGWCSASGYDLATGWGTFNALQMAWAINWEDNLAYSAPSVVYSGPTTNKWYNTSQTVSWTINANSNPTGIAGFTQGWDSIPSDPSGDTNRNHSNSFFSGPQFPNSTAGCLAFVGGSCAGGVSQGCHTAHVRAWSNQGSSSGDTTYGPVCYDSVAPVTTATLSGTLNGSVYDTAVKVTLGATDATSGVAHTYYSIDGSGYATYSGPFTISALGSHTVRFYSLDNANNTESVKSVRFVIASLTTTSLFSSLNPSQYQQNVTFTATVTPSVGGTPTGTVAFMHHTTVLGTGNLIGGKASFSISNLSVGTTHITAVYNGSTNDLTSTSNAVAQVVNQTSTSTSLTSSVNPSTYGQSITFTATVTPKFGGTPTGTVTFMHHTTVLGTGNLIGGKASFSISNLSVGTTHITAVYNGSTNDLTSTSNAVAQVVNKASTTSKVTSPLNPAKAGTNVTFTATVTAASGPIPAGTVTFPDGANTLSTGTLNSTGEATFSTTTLSKATHSIAVHYGGSTLDSSSASAALSQVID